MSKHGNVEKVVAKLQVLRDSCTGVINSDRSNSYLLWFRGAEAMLIVAVDDLQRALNEVKSIKPEETSASASIEEDASVDKPKVEKRPKPKH
jgi:hypothetical protein